MEKHILKFSYWLGVISLLCALIFRFVNIIYPADDVIQTMGEPVGYNAFLHGAFLFFAASVASALYARSKPQPAVQQEPVTRESAGSAVEENLT